MADAPFDALRPTPGAAFAAWAARVQANRDQVERFREAADPADYYGPVTATFRADPRRTDEPLLDDLIALARPGETWLDIGAGAGRYALPLALRVGPVVAVEPSPGMADALEAGAADARIDRVTVLRGGWPPEAPTTGGRLGQVPTGDVALIAHLGYDIEAFDAFFAAMESAARRLCVAVLMERQPSSVADELWPIVHGEERVPLPGMRALVAVLIALGRDFEVRLHERPPRAWESEEEALGFLRRHVWVAEGSRKDAVLRAAVHERLVDAPGGGVLLRSARAQAIGLISWRPAGAGA